MSLGLGEAGGGVAPVAVRAAEDDIPAEVHAGILDCGMTLKATGAFAGCFRQRLINPIARRQGVGRLGQITRHRNRRPKALVGGEHGKSRAEERGNNRRKGFPRGFRTLDFGSGRAGKCLHGFHFFKT